MIKLLEKKLLVKVRKEDLKLVNDLKEECEKEFSEIMMQETNAEYKCQIEVLSSDFLTVEEGGECGGLTLMSENRRIVCANTLKMRLDLVFEELLPVIRKELFPEHKK